MRPLSGDLQGSSDDILSQIKVVRGVRTILRQPWRPDCKVEQSDPRIVFELVVVVICPQVVSFGFLTESFVDPIVERSNYRQQFGFALLMGELTAVIE